MLTLWGRNNSTNVKKVRWCLAELGMEYTPIPAGGQFGLNHDDAYLAMNPNGLVPCLKDDAQDLVLWESNTIVRYLLAEYGTTTLWPAQPARRAAADKWMDWVVGTFTAPFRGVFISLVRTAPADRDQALINRSVKECNALMAILDQQLATTTWLAGDEFSMAEIAIAPTIYALINLEVDWQPHPHLRRWYQQLTERPAFRDTVMLPIS